MPKRRKTNAAEFPGDYGFILNRVRILIIASEFPPGPGGIGNHAHQLALNLCQLGWETIVVSPQDYAMAHEVEEFNAAQPFRINRMSSGRGQFREALQRLQ